MKKQFLQIIFLLCINSLSAQDYLTTKKQLKIWKPTSEVISIREKNPQTGLYEEIADKILFDVKYDGQTQNGLAEGQGTATYSYKKTKYLKYEGTFKNGLPNGTGKLTYTFKDNYFIENYYSGEFCNGLFEGKGVRYSIAKDASKCLVETKYSGEFKSGKYNGRVTFLKTNKCEWGTESTSYDGEWKDGVKQGSGNYTGKYDYLNNNERRWIKILDENETYEGDWANDIPHGKGKFTLKNGKSYQGDVVQGQMTGFGKINFSNGDSFSGKIIKGEIADSGAYYYANGQLLFDGRWDNGNPSGFGIYEDPKRNRYEGYFIAGKLIGNELPLLAKKDNVEPLNRDIYKNIKFYDIFNACEYSSRFQFVNNGTALTFRSGNLLDLSTLKFYSFGEEYEIANLTSTAGITFDPKTSTFNIYDYINKVKKSFKIEGVNTEHSKHPDKWNRPYNVSADGSLIIVEREKGGNFIVSTVTGEILWLNSKGKCFLSPDNSYIINIEVIKASNYAHEIQFNLSVFDFATRKLLGSKNCYFNFSSGFNIYFNPNKKFFLGLIDKGTQNGELYDISQNKLSQINESLTKENYIYYAQGNWKSNNNSSSYNIFINDKLNHFVNIKEYDENSIYFGNKGEEAMPIKGISVYRLGTYYDHKGFFIENENKKICLDTTSGKNRMYEFSDPTIDSLYRYGKEKSRDYKLVTRDSLLIMYYYKRIAEIGDRDFLRIYNIPNLLENSGQEKVRDYNTALTEKFNEELIQKIYKNAARDLKWKKFRNAISYNDFIYVASSNSRDLVDWVNSKSANEIKQFDNINVFVGGEVHNSSDTTYNVEVKVKILTRKTRTALFIMSETEQETTELSNYITVKPGQTVPFLVCLKNLKSGYFNSSSGWGSRTVLDDPAYRVYVSFYEGKIEASTLSNQKNLINEFLSYGNLKQEESIFNMDNSLTELNVYYLTKKDYNDLQFEFKKGYLSGKTYKSTKTYTGYKCHFIVNPNDKCEVTILGKTYYPIIKKGIVQMFINENGNVTYEYKTK